MSRGQRALGLGLLLALALGPLACAPILEDAYRLPQWLALAMATLLLGVGILFGSELVKPRGALALAGLFYFAWRGVSHALSGPLELAWLCEWALTGSLFGVLACGNQASRALALRAGLWGAVAVAAYACAQGLGWDPLAKDAVELGFSRRAYATLGNPDFLGGYLALALPLVLDAWLRQRGRVWAVFLISTALALTQARAAWLAGALGAAWVCVQAWRAGQLRGRRLAGLFILPLLLLILLSGTHALNPRGLDSLRRLASLTNINDDGWQGRLAMSTIALDLAWSRPLTGVGAGRFADAYAQAQGERLNREGGVYRNTPHAHNDWLQTAAESGLPGLFFLLALWFFGLRQAWVTKAWGTVGALLAFSVHAAAHFPLAIVPSAMLFWALLGCLCEQRQTALSRRGSQAVGVGLVALSIVSLLLFGRHAQASALLRRGQELALAGRPDLARPVLGSANRLWPEDVRAPLALAVQWDKLGDSAAALAAAQAALRAQASSAEAWNILGLSLGKLGDLRAADAALRHSLSLNPNSHEAWGNLATALAGAGDLSNAKQALLSALALKPDWALGQQNLKLLERELQKQSKAGRGSR